MKTALILGSTGLVGSELVKQLQASGMYDKIILPVRRLSGIHGPAVKEVLYNFDKPDPSVMQANDIYCCLGTTIKNAGSQKNFYRVDVTYVVESAKAGYANGAERFALVSAMGANARSSVFYNRSKGEVEEAVCRIGYSSCFIFRPSLLLGNRSEFRFGEKVAGFLMRIFSFIIPKRYKAIEASSVAAAMVSAMKSHKTGLRVFESDQISNM